MRLSLFNFFETLPLTRPARMLLLLGLWACDGQDSRPNELIPAEKMANILTDIHIAEARVSTLGLHSLDSSLKAYDSLQVDIWRHNEIDSSLYAQSYAYYTTNPAILAEIYVQVDSNLAKRVRSKNIQY